ncbi:hypothetical protein [Roseovarius sp. D22-M7]|uniref:hypothetical protein n=1 Tax=Roseovarius sp. D22-M7 TaxID=3127116 RepID=UPI0030102E49
MTPARSGIARRALALVACLPLAACLEPPPSAPVAQEALRAVSFYGGTITVAGPRGYCIDRSSIKSDGGGRFAILASCESLTGRAGIAVDPAMMTVAVLPRAGTIAPPDAAAMAGVLGADAVRSVEERDDITLVQVAEGGEAVLPGGDPVHWRASMVINGHMLGLAAYGPKGGAIAGPRGREVLGELAAALRAASVASNGS